jgi:hypothetical protein
MTTVINEDVRVNAALVATSLRSGTASLVNADIAASAEIARSKLAQDTNQAFSVPLTQFRTWDALAVNLPATPGADDLGLDNATFGTGSPHLTAGDLGAAGSTTRYARAHVVVPVEYDDGQTFTIRLHSGCLTAVSDTTCTCDVELYRSDEATGISADLCSTAATTCNSLTFSDVDFVITPTTLVSGDTLDLRVALICNDAATAVVEPVIGAVQLLCDVRG